MRRGERVNVLKDIPTPQQEKKGFRCGLGISGTQGVGKVI